MYLFFLVNVLILNSLHLPVDTLARRPGVIASGLNIRMNYQSMNYPRINQHYLAPKWRPVLTIKFA